MKIQRDFSILINNFLDWILPPVLRDSKLFMYLPFRLLFKKKAEIFLKFKDKAFQMNDREFAHVYRRDIRQSCAWRNRS